MTTRLDELKARRERMDARIREMEEREAAREREARERACAALGRAAVARLGGDWRAVDYAAVDALLARAAEGGLGPLTREPVGAEEALRAAEAVGGSPSRRARGKAARDGGE